MGVRTADAGVGGKTERGAGTGKRCEGVPLEKLGPSGDRGLCPNTPRPFPLGVTFADHLGSMAVPSMACPHLPGMLTLTGLPCPITDCPCPQGTVTAGSPLTAVGWAITSALSLSHGHNLNLETGREAAYQWGSHSTHE